MCVCVRVCMDCGNIIKITQEISRDQKNMYNVMRSMSSVDGFGWCGFVGSDHGSIELNPLTYPWPGLLVCLLLVGLKVRKLGSKFWACCIL